MYLQFPQGEWLRRAGDAHEGVDRLPSWRRHSGREEKPEERERNGDEETGNVKEKKWETKITVSDFLFF